MARVKTVARVGPVRSSEQPAHPPPQSVAPGPRRRPTASERKRRLEENASEQPQADEVAEEVPPHHSSESDSSEESSSDFEADEHEAAEEDGTETDDELQPVPEPEPEGEPEPEPEPELEPEPEPQQRRRRRRREPEAEADVPEDGPPFGGGPADLSVLAQYRDHVAERIWRGVERPTLKCVSHMKDISGYPPPTEEIRAIMDAAGLGSLRLCVQKLVDHGLIDAFCERWHGETSSFHLPVGEMAITLDDVACLTGLPIHGELFSLPVYSNTEAALLARDRLGMSIGEAAEEVRLAKGPSLRLRFLKETLIPRLVAAGQTIQAAKAYLLLVLGSTFYADKSWSAIQLGYLQMMEDMEHLNRYAWGAIALACLYDHLKAASRFDCRQVGGFIGLLQMWIFAHFPRITGRATRVSATYQVGHPLGGRFECIRSRLSDLRTRLDDMTDEDVRWTPYSGVRQHHPFDERSLYSGCIRHHDRAHRYLPERVLRQFGYIQTVPLDPPALTPVEH